MLVDDDDAPAADISGNDLIDVLDSLDDEDGPRERRQLHRMMYFIENTVHAYDDEEFRIHLVIKVF